MRLPKFLRSKASIMLEEQGVKKDDPSYPIAYFLIQMGQIKTHDRLSEQLEHSRGFLEDLNRVRGGDFQNEEEIKLYAQISAYDEMISEKE
jgi:hypothetical protein